MKIKQIRKTKEILQERKARKINTRTKEREKERIEKKRIERRTVTPVGGDDSPSQQRERKRIDQMRLVKRVKRKSIDCFIFSFLFAVLVLFVLISWLPSRQSALFF